MADYDALDVRLHGASIGTLARLGRDRIVFAFDRGYARDRARPVLSLSFRDPFGHLITDIPPTRTWAPPFFSNLLPEGPLRDYLARSAGLDPRREFPLLAALGRDLPGAVTVLPLEPGPDAVVSPGASADHGTTERLSGVGRSSHPVVDRPRRTPDSVHDAARPRTPPLRFSLPGVQPKLSAATTHTGRFTVPASGVGGSWIVKLPTTAFPGLPEQEHAMMTLAGRIGIDVPETLLVPTDAISHIPSGLGVHGGTHALAVRRFDRSTDGTRVHVEDFAQVFDAHPEQKYVKAGYRDIARVVAAEIGNEAVCEFVRRLVFCALIGNGDAHLKNWAVIYPDRRTPALAPAYDLVSTIAFVDDDRLALELLDGARRFEDLSEALLRRLASSARVPQAMVVGAARRTVERFMAVWGEAKRDASVPRGVARAIDAHLPRLPLVSVHFSSR